MRSKNKILVALKKDFSTFWISEKMPVVFRIFCKLNLFLFQFSGWFFPCQLLRLCGLFSFLCWFLFRCIPQELFRILLLFFLRNLFFHKFLFVLLMKFFLVKFPARCRKRIEAAAMEKIYSVSEEFLVSNLCFGMRGLKIDSGRSQRFFLFHRRILFL